MVEDKLRHSSKEMVALAQEIMKRTAPDKARFRRDQGTNWLVESARSLAGSVISQADPND